MYKKDRVVKRLEYPDFTGANCAGLDTNEFYVKDDRGTRELYPNIAVLKKICSNCPLSAQCLEWALQHENYGFWAGTTERDRNHLRAKLGISYVAYEMPPYVSRAVEGAKTKARNRAMKEAENDYSDSRPELDW